MSLTAEHRLQQVPLEPQSHPTPVGRQAADSGGRPNQIEHMLCCFQRLLNTLGPQERGPLTQATGPPRSGAGVGVGMLRGAGDPLA